MSRSVNWLPLAGASTLGLALLLGVGAAQAEPTTIVPASSSLSAGLRQDPAATPAYIVLKVSDSYRFQDRPWARIPTGVSVRLRAPAGVTTADLHNAVVGGEVLSKDGVSPATVPGARLEVKRVGGDYELRITAADTKAAREIQRRAAALR